MFKKSIARMILVIFALTLFISVGMSAPNKDKKRRTGKVKNSRTVCSKTTDADLIQAIKEKFAADPEIKDQMRHINVSVKKRVVKLEGWLDGQNSIIKAIVIAKKTKCVRRVISQLKENGSGSCGAGQVPCGDTCIDKRSVCTITTVDN